MVLFEWKDSKNDDVGIIAQNLEALFQDDVLNGRLIEKRNDTYYVRFNSLLTIVIKALQELAHKVAESDVNSRTIVQSEIQKWERERDSVTKARKPMQRNWRDVPVAHQVVNFLIVVGNSIGLYKYFSCTACGCHAKHTQIRFGCWKCTSKKCPLKGRRGVCAVHPSFFTPQEYSRQENSRWQGAAPSLLFVLFLYCFLRYRHRVFL